MQEFISILISFIFMSIADSVDSAFNNYISVDAVVVCGSLIFINFMFKSIGEIGIYTHRTVRKNSASYLLISGITGLILGIISFSLSDFIVNLFDLTFTQKGMLSDILKLYIIYLPISVLHTGMLEVVRLKNDLKLYRKGLIITYISLIALDALAFILTKDLFALYIATILSNIICFIYLAYKIKLIYPKITKEDLNNVKLYGVPYSMERVFSRALILLYGVLASNLGTEKYAIHTICYSVCLTLETITNAYQATLMIKVPEGQTNEKQYRNYIEIITNAYQAIFMIKVPEGQTYEQQYRNCMKMKNKCFPLIILLNFIFAFIYLIISHGSVPILECFPYFLFYIISVFGLYQYETYKTLCITQGKSYILLIGSAIGAIIRFLICLAFLKTSFALFVFGIVNLIDFYSRSIVYKIMLFKLYKKDNLDIRKNRDENLNV